MDKAQLQVRAENRKKWAQTADRQDSLVAEIGTAWLQQAALKWNPAVQPKVPEGIPVGSEFIRFVKNFMKQNGFRTLEFGEGAVKAGAEAVAHWIDFNGTRIVGIDFPNPLTEIDKAKGEGYMVASNAKQTKTAQQHTVYGPIERERVGIYAEPDEWTRYCPEHPGVMMRRVKDGLYQCPMKGEVFSYTDGHDVEHTIHVQNQTNPNWNKTWPQKSFLDTPNQQSTRASGGTYDGDSKKEHPKYTENKDITHKSHTPDLYANEGAMKGKKEKKEASKKYRTRIENEVAQPSSWKPTQPLPDFGIPQSRPVSGPSVMGHNPFDIDIVVYKNKSPVEVTTYDEAASLVGEGRAKWRNIERGAANNTRS